MATLAELDPRSISPNPRNPRFELLDLQDLIDSIKAVGVLQPIVVFPDTPPTETPAHASEVLAQASPENRQYMILIGHRRHAAVLQLELPTIPCIIAESEAVAQQLVKILAEAGKAGLRRTRGLPGYVSPCRSRASGDSGGRVVLRGCAGSRRL